MIFYTSFKQVSLLFNLRNQRISNENSQTNSKKNNSNNNKDTQILIAKRSQSCNNHELVGYHCCHHCKNCHHHKSKSNHNHHHHHHKSHNSHKNHSHYHQDRQHKHNSHRSHVKHDQNTYTLDGATDQNNNVSINNKNSSKIHHQPQKKPSKNDKENENYTIQSNQNNFSELISNTTTPLNINNNQTSTKMPSNQTKRESNLSSELSSNLWGQARVVMLVREENKSLGISIVGGKLDVHSNLNSNLNSPSHSASINATTQSATSNHQQSFITGIFIKHVLENSPAGLNGTLKTGDRILAVNDIDLTNASHDKAVEVIRNAKSPIKFIIQSLLYVNSTDINPISNNNTNNNNNTQTLSLEKSVEKKDTSELVESQATPSLPPQSTATNQIHSQNVNEISPNKNALKTSSEEQVLNLDKIIINQSNKYDYSLDKMKEKYSYLLESPSLNLTTDSNAKDQVANETLNDNLSSTNRELCIFKLTRSTPGESLGLSLSGNVNLDKTSVFVCSIYTNSIAQNHGLVRVGDQILEINGQSIYGRAHSNVTPLIKNIKDLEVYLVILRSADNLLQMFKPLFLNNLNTKSGHSTSTTTTSAALETLSFSNPPLASISSSTNSSSEHNTQATVINNNAATLKNTALKSSNSFQSTKLSTSISSPSCSLTQSPRIYRIITLKKGSSGFGIAISEDKHNRLIVRGLNPNGVAFSDGRMHIGDEIVAVNGIRVNSMKYDEIMTLLHETKDPVEFECIKADLLTNSNSSNQASGACSPTTSSIRKQINFKLPDVNDSPNKNTSNDLKTNQIRVGEETWIEIDRGRQGLGLSLVGGSDTQLAGIIIHDIYNNGAAYRDKRLMIGDQVLKVNDIDLINATHEQALNALRRQTSDSVKLLIHRVNMPLLTNTSKLLNDDNESALKKSSKEDDIENSNNSGGTNTPSSSGLGLADLLNCNESEKFLNVINIELAKKFGKGLGFSIIGRRDGSGVFISHIVSHYCYIKSHTPFLET
jgi:C-terminal processing protease CtpA/Prc